MADKMIRIIMLTMVILGLGLTNEVLGQDIDPPDFADSALKLNGLFDIMNSYLHSIQPSTFADFVEAFEIESFDDISLKKEDQKSGLLWALAGYVVAAICGIIFIVVMGITCCCMCCCRCCCKTCGAKTNFTDGRQDRCQSICCSISFLVVTCFLLGSVVCAFLATNAIAETLPKENGVINDVIKSIDELEGFKDTALEDIGQVVVVGVNDTLSDLTVIVHNLPEEAFGKLDNISQAGPLLAQLSTFADSMPDLNASLAGMMDGAAELPSEATNLQTELDKEKLDILNVLSKCDQIMFPTCKEAANMTNDLNIDAQYLNLSDVTNQHTLISAVIASNNSDLIKAGMASFEGITDDVDKILSDEIDKFDVIADEIVREVEDGYKELYDSIVGFTFQQAKDTLEEISPILEEYGAYVVYGFFVLNSCLAIIVVLYYLGLIFGCACKSPKEKSSCCACTSKTGANFLLSGVGLTFVFTGLFMLLTMVLFLAGGATYNNTCRYILPYSDSMRAVEKLLKAQLNLNWTGGVGDILNECKEDKALYTALDLESNGYNITAVLDLDQYGLDDVIEGIKNISIDIGTVEILDPNVNTSMIGLGKALNDIDYDTYRDELEKGLTTVDVLALADLLDTTAQAVNESAMAARLKIHARHLRKIESTSIANIETMRNVLANDVRVSSEITTATRLDLLMIELTQAQDNLNTYGNLVLEEVVDNSVDDVYSEAVAFTQQADYDVRNNVANCWPLYASTQRVASDACVYTLNPVNSLWFCYGWFMNFSVPAIILAINLAGLYRRRLKYNAIHPIVGMEMVQPAGNPPEGHLDTTKAKGQQSTPRVAPPMEMVQPAGKPPEGHLHTTKSKGQQSTPRFPPPKEAW